MAESINLGTRCCPYCSSTTRKLFGVRLSTSFVRCGDCGSIYMDITPTEFAQRHSEAFTDDSFVTNIVHQRQLEPNFEVWNQFSHLFPVGSLLELGPGTGHFMAAARASGREVWAVEASVIHRQFIKTNWGFEHVYEKVEELPDSQRFAVIAMFNVIEHVYNVKNLMRMLRDRLQPGGVILVSTANAGCVIVPLVGQWWSMFKPHDHVSIPTAEGLRCLARDTALQLEQTWTTELPLETPIGIAVAARDYFYEQLMQRKPAYPMSMERMSNTEIPPNPPPSVGKVSLSRQLAHRLINAGKLFDPTSRITAPLGIAASIKGLFINNIHRN